MKTSFYTLYSTKLFGTLLAKLTPEQDAEKTILLEQADIDLDIRTYGAIALMTILLGGIVSVLFALLLSAYLPAPYTILGTVGLPAAVILGLCTLFYYLPIYKRTSRAANIDLFLPYAINFINSMSVAGISPAEIFTTLATIDAYGEIQIEAKKIAKEINIMGIDNITALKHGLIRTPSKKFKAFLQGMIGTIQSGSDLHTYLSTIVEKYMQEDLRARKKDLDVLSVTAEVFVTAAIALPIFLVIILSVMGFFGGPIDFSISFLFFFSFVILPLIYVGFYFLIKTTGIEKIIKVKPEKHKAFRQWIMYHKKPLVILLLSACIPLLLYGMLLLLNLYGIIDFALYLHLDILFMSVLIIIVPLGIYYYLQARKITRIQERLPEFLTEISNSLSSGMTIFNTIKVADKGHYGALAPEISKMKTQLSWNVTIKNVFHDFAARMKSAIIQRMVITITKGLMMGGNTPKIFEAAAREVEQINQIESQRKANMSLYALVIFMCFFTFLAIMIILDKTILASFMEIQQQQLSSGGFMTMHVVDPLLRKYALYSFVFVQSIGAGILSGYMMDGSLSSGVRYSAVLAIISFIIFKLFF